jgi:hypothetical protein
LLRARDSTVAVRLCTWTSLLLHGGGGGGGVKGMPQRATKKWAGALGEVQRLAGS